jgi:DNA-binding transcriptional regulator YiaG
MANVGKVLKAEISRVSRKEAKSAVGPIGKSHTTLKKVLADLKRRVAALETETKRLVTAVGKEEAKTPPKPSKETKKARITSKGIRSLRRKLGLSQADFAKLVGASEQSVYLWESKEGPLNLRENTKAALLSIKEMGPRDAKEKLGKAEAKK